MTKSRNILRPRQFWTDAELDLLRSMYPDCHGEDCAAWLGKTLSGVYQAAKKLGARKSAEYLASDTACRVSASRRTPGMVANQFKPGVPSWSKGTKGRVGVQEACRATQFKKGVKPHTWLPLGSLRVSKDGYLQRKCTDTGYPPKDWRSVHALVWEGEHGSIPPGSVVVFKAGAKTTDLPAITADKLECLTRAQLMKRNSVHTVYPPEVARLVLLRGALNRQINSRTRGQESA